MGDLTYFARTVLGVELHSGQKKWLKKSVKSENLLVTGNRWGKSFVCAVKIIHHAIFRPRLLKYNRKRYRICTASITQDQANIIFSQVISFINESELLGSLVSDYKRSPYPKLELGNRVTVEARSTQNRGEYLLGNDFDLFIFDEVAFETDPEYVVEEVILMRLADREGRLDLVSTPNGRNWFYLRAQDILSGRRKGYFQSGDSRENRNISSRYLKQRLESFSEKRVLQNIKGQFVDSGGEILRGEYVDRALRKHTAQEDLSDRDNGQFLSGWDLARKQTATVGITVEVRGDQVRVVELERFRKFDWKIVIEKMKQRQDRFPGRLIVDATGLGDVVVEQLSEYKPESVIFTQSRKAELLTHLEMLHARERICYSRWELPDGAGRIWSLEDELRQAQWDNNNRCDALMALALAVWPLRKGDKITPAPRLGRV
ncbi:MAG: terminase family protein [bacterium]|nr:terminase family protein [bacterium]